MFLETLSFSLQFLVKFKSQEPLWFWIGPYEIINLKIFTVLLFMKYVSSSSDIINTVHLAASEDEKEMINAVEKLSFLKDNLGASDTIASYKDLTKPNINYYKTCLTISLFISSIKVDVIFL